MLTGRLATCAIVVPTAVALDRKVGAFGNKSFLFERVIFLEMLKEGNIVQLFSRGG